MLINTFSYPISNMCCTIVQIQNTLLTKVTINLNRLNQHAGLIGIELITIVTSCNLVNSRNDAKADTRQGVLEEELNFLVLIGLHHVYNRLSKFSVDGGSIYCLITQTLRSNTPQ